MADLIRIRLLFPSGVEQTVTASEIKSINGVPFDTSKFLTTTPQEFNTEVAERLTALESRAKLLEAGVGYCLDRMGLTEILVEDNQGSEPPAPDSTNPQSGEKSDG